MSAVVQPPSLFHRNRYILKPEHWERIRLSLRLSLREMQITQYIFDDEKTECIASELGISVHTANTYLRRLYFKLDVRSRPQLILRVLKEHLDYLAETRKPKTETYDAQGLMADVAPIDDTRTCDLLVE
ncbi:MAG TPA: helix-turn-helix transcriptional regulator [Candidatus Angelobacter sp.]|jgi:DNA-binding CsgD family transcriptional regulator|nr:helix-turn-helix transcriptional regulator [Candidatus Angelobacter sp.]